MCSVGSSLTLAPRLRLARRLTLAPRSPLCRCRAQGLFSGRLCRKPLFRQYVRSYEPRAVFPHEEVQFNIALCIKELQDEEQLARLTALQKEFNYGPCIGLPRTSL